ncbi:hypothetical protein, partial [Chryseobacterium sp. CCH4-E10]|uniref:hypothetical protein n=1 Tax=Chryseobacterium sp. CCH4-E10 TaxID=1768758 RepID=UPI000A88EA50
KDIGDAVAFTFIHKLDIKPQNFKESAGFITQKIGFKKEKRIFKQIFDKGYIAILNDLTSTLRYCDIMIITKEGYFPIEVKTSNNKNPRVNRQHANANKLFSYLSEDFTEGLYDLNYPMHRVASSKEKNYIKEFNDLLKISKQEGYAYKLVERGVLYMIMHTDQFENIDLKSIFKSKKLNTPTYFFVNQMKFLEAGYYPFSLSISNPEDYFDFVQGNFVFSIFIDFNILQKLSKK